MVKHVCSSASGERADSISAEPPSDEYLDQEELDFVCGFDALMEAAHYNRLSQAEWETADREEFTVSVFGGFLKEFLFFNIFIRTEMTFNLNPNTKS